MGLVDRQNGGQSKYETQLLPIGGDYIRDIHGATKDAVPASGQTMFARFSQPALPVSRAG